MASEEDNFELDLDGDYEDPDAPMVPHQQDGTADNEDLDDASEDEVIITVDGPPLIPPSVAEKPSLVPSNGFQDEGYSDSPAVGSSNSSKRDDTADERPIDNGATSALLVSELHWYTTEDDIRGWINQAGCEDELKEITFSEHKVNGKSKGYERTSIPRNMPHPLTSQQASLRRVSFTTSIHCGQTQNRFLQLC